MIYAGPTDQMADTANTCVYAMSLSIDLVAGQATATDAGTATYKLAATLEAIAACLDHIKDGQEAATSAETAAMAECVTQANKAAQAAREAAAMTLNRHETTEPTP